MNMQDYALWRGDLSFSKDPFNEVDNVIFSYIVYTDLTNIVDYSNTKITFHDAIEKFFANHDLNDLQANKSFIAQSPFLFQTCGNTVRFKDLKLHHYVNEIDSKQDLQFSALCIDIDDETTYISFCGTDDTIVGWKEDFQMSYKLIYAQQKSKQYLQEVIKPHHKYYIGGHSKGGNLALYACCKVDPKLIENVLHIYSNDGPGLSDDIFSLEEFETIKERYTKIVPEECVIGNIFYHPCHTIVVEASDFALMQHQAMGWQVIGNHFVHKENISDLSSRFALALNNLLTQLDEQKREQLVTDGFNAIAEANIVYVSEIFNDPVAVLSRLLAAIHKMDPSSKKIALKFTNVITDIFNSYIDDYKYKAKKKFSNSHR